MRPERQGSDLPILFLLPGSAGYNPSLAALAAEMGKIAWVIPIRYPPLQDILRGHSSVEAMAASAIKQIGRAQPAGHVRLLGHSLGDAVAFETAKLLLEAGRPAKFIGILDTSVGGEPSAYGATLVRTFRKIRGNRVAAKRIACRAVAKIAARLGYEARLASILDRHSKRRFGATRLRIKLELQEVLRQRAFFKWLEQARPMLPIAAILFRCERPERPRTLGWDRAFAGLDVIPIAPAKPRRDSAWRA